jgi:signal transduction histidine kinase
MTRRLVISYLAVTAFALTLFAIPLAISFSNHERDKLLAEIETDADGMSANVSDAIAQGKPIPQAEIIRYSSVTGGHVIVVDKQGRALLDTDPSEPPSENYANRPEVAAALSGRRVEGTRHSDTAGTTLLYAAVPTSDDGKVNGAVRITYPTATLNDRVHHAWGQLALLSLGVLAAVAVIAYLIARSLSRPLRSLDSAAERVARGDLTARVAEDTGPPELRHLAGTFNHMTERVSYLLVAQQRFVADASHQLRTPLTALRLRIENLEAHVDARDRAAIDAAADEVARMSRLVDGLLVLARDESANRISAPVDVVAVARERADVWSSVVEERDVRLVVEAPAHAWATTVSGAVEQLVDNLVDNAYQVAPAGSAITIRVANVPRLVEMHVIDAGPGLALDERKRAFDRFWRAPDAAPGGSGIGLAIVRQLAEASGGSAWLDAAPEGGVDAVVVLPSCAPPVRTTAPAAETLTSP